MEGVARGAAKPISVHVSKKLILLSTGFVPDLSCFLLFLAFEPEPAGIGAQGKHLHVLPSRWRFSSEHDTYSIVVESFLTLGKVRGVVLV